MWQRRYGDLCGTINAIAEKESKKENEAGAKGSITVKCDNGRTTTYTFGGDKKAYTLDGGSSTPYTGSGFDSSQVKPEKEDDTNRVFPKITPDGHGDVVTGGDLDGTDDTGKFYGGIMGGRTSSTRIRAAPVRLTRYVSRLIPIPQ